MHENPTIEEEDFELEAVQGVYGETWVDDIGVAGDAQEDDGVFWTAPGECTAPSALDAAIGAFAQSIASLAESSLGVRTGRMP